MTTSQRLDEDVLADVSRLGFDRELLLDSIKTRQSNKATVTYYLLLDNRQRGPSNAYLHAELSESAPPTSGGAPPVPALAGHPASVPAPGGATGQRLVAERRWRLGVHSRGHPSHIMLELYRVLTLHGVAWKRLGPYNLRCRRVVQAAPRREPPAAAAGGPAASSARPTPLSVRPHHPQQQHLLLPQHSPGSSVGGASSMGQHRLPQQQPTPPAQPQRMSDDAEDDKLEGMDGITMEDGAGKHESACADAGAAEPEQALKFEASMYKVRDDEYVIDIQRVSGDLFIFMDICGRILSDVRL